jgi:hypothetical protein
MARQQAKATVRPQLNKDMLVPVASFTTGHLVYINTRNGMEWNWHGFGATDDIELGELITMKSAQPKFIYEPWLIILNDEVVDYLGLTSFYETLMKPDDVDRVFSLPDKEMEELLTNAPSGVKRVVALRAKELIEKNEFDSIRKKNIIERLFKVKLTQE